MTTPPTPSSSNVNDGEIQANIPSSTIPVTTTTPAIVSSKLRHNETLTMAETSSLSGMTTSIKTSSVKQIPVLPGKSTSTTTPLVTQTLLLPETVTTIPLLTQPPLTASTISTTKHDNMVPSIQTPTTLTKKSKMKNPLGYRELIQLQKDMGRSRRNLHITDDQDCSQRSRRKKNVYNENTGSSSSGQRTNEGKRALYHCNYCNKDITGRIRIKCAICPDFDLCIECFTVGAEISPHKSNHPYRIMDNLSFSLISPDWNADEEILLLEGIDMYGLCNWAEVSEHVGTKDIKLCVDHYTKKYLRSPFFPFPDMSHVAGKNKKELLNVATGHAEDKKGASMIAKLSLKEKSHFSPSKARIGEPRKSGSSGRSVTSAKTDSQSQRKSNGKKSISPLDEMHGYNSKRQEFDVEYDNDAEQMLAEMEFKDTDTKEEREIKLRVLRIYLKRIDERQHRKDFIKERNLLQPNPFERDLSTEERALCRQYDVFMRFHSKKDHEELLRTVISEHRMKERIQDLKDARAAGCRSTTEADRWLELKRRLEAEASRRIRESSQGGPSSQDGSNAFVFEAGRPAAQASLYHVNDFDIMRFREVTLLSEAEKRLCAEVKLPPPLYMKMQEIISRGVFSCNVKKKADAHRFFKIDPSIVDTVFEMLVKKGLIPPP